MIRPLAFALCLWTLAAQAQCDYRKTLYLDWSPCGQKILPGTPLGNVLGVNPGTVIPMEQPNGTRKLSIRVFRWVATDTVACPVKRWWIEGGINSTQPCVQ